VGAVALLPPAAGAVVSSHQLCLQQCCGPLLVETWQLASLNPKFCASCTSPAIFLSSLQRRYSYSDSDSDS